MTFKSINLPNRLTLLRMLLVPVFIACFYLDRFISWWNILAAAVMFIASMTDVVDGKIARKYGLVTNFGKLIDPIADKLLYCSAFIMLTDRGWLPALFTVIFIGREFVISGFRLIATKQGTVIAADWMGKAKATFQAIGIISMLLENPIFRLIGFRFDLFCMVLAAIFAIWSCYNYIHTHIGAIDLT